jgi:hypothetical protein
MFTTYTRYCTGFVEQNMVFREGRVTKHKVNENEVLNRRGKMKRGGH